jgi:CheY-like chemotaxis protein
MSHFNCTVLVVEDDPLMLAHAVEEFRTLGCRVLDAHRGEHAFVTLMSHPEVRLVFADLLLPGIDGKALARQMRQVRPGLAIALTSGYANPDADGSLMFVPKPWRRGDLERVLEAATRTLPLH